MLPIHTLYFINNTESLNKKLKLYQLVISFTFMGIHIYIVFSFNHFYYFCHKNVTQCCKFAAACLESRV